MTKREKITHLTIVFITLAVFWTAAFITYNEEKEAPAIPTEAPAETRQTATTAHALTRRENYTSLVKNAPQRSQSAATEAPTEEPTEEPTEAPTPAPTEAPTPEPTPTRYTMLATAYSSDPAENGGFGAVDCRFGMTLPADAIAADLAFLPYGTRVKIAGVGERVVVDTASKKTIAKMTARAEAKGAAGWIDIYFGDDKAGALQWGLRLVEIEIIEWGDGK